MSTPKGEMREVGTTVSQQEGGVPMSIYWGIDTERLISSSLAVLRRTVYGWEKNFQVQYDQSKPVAIWLLVNY